jgi:hypothetical protein
MGAFPPMNKLFGIVFELRRMIGERGIPLSNVVNLKNIQGSVSNMLF